MAKALTKTQYQALLSKLKKLAQQKELNTKTKSEQTLIKLYWQMGRCIAAARLTKKAGYHNSVLNDLARDLRISVRTLQRTVKLHGAYRAPPRDNTLSWAHLRILIEKKDPDERAHYEKLALEGLSARQLEQAAKNDHYARARKAKGNAVKLKRPTSKDYLYFATTINVIDGDTVRLLVDLGFDQLSRRKLRLANIDALEKGSAHGRRAKNWLNKQLLAANQIVVATNKSDLHGRYIAHIFYTTTSRKKTKEKIFAQGRYLNQELVTQGYARAI